MAIENLRVGIPCGSGRVTTYTITEEAAPSTDTGLSVVYGIECQSSNVTSVNEYNATVSGGTVTFNGLASATNTRYTIRVYGI